MSAIIKNLRLFCLMVSSAVVVSSCKETIKLDLKSAEPHIVLEAEISDHFAQHYLRISKSKAYYDNNTFTAVSGAFVVLTDDAGLIDTMHEGIPVGYYYTSVPQGIPGHTYRLHVEAEGQQYDAVSYMPFPVQLDTFGVISFSVPGRDPIKSCAMAFIDPAAYTNYYHYLAFQNGKRGTRFTVGNDQFTNGKLKTATVSPDDDIKSGDTLTIWLESINQNVYNYFRELNSITSSRNQTAAPANPQNNWTNNALGYFNAFSYTEKTIIAP